MNKQLEINSWYSMFVLEVLDMFGIPMLPEVCRNNFEKAIHMWGETVVINECIKHKGFWKLLRRRSYAPEDAAYYFVKYYYNITGKMILEMPEVKRS